MEKRSEQANVQGVRPKNEGLYHQHSHWNPHENKSVARHSRAYSYIQGCQVAALDFPDDIIIIKHDIKQMLLKIRSAIRVVETFKKKGMQALLRPSYYILSTRTRIPLPE